MTPGAIVLSLSGFVHAFSFLPFSRYTVEMFLKDCWELMTICSEPGA